MKLWREYAIEPALFANYYLGSEILAGIGFDNGRIVGAIPKKWSRAVRNHALAYSDMQKARLVQRLESLKNAIIPRNYAYDGNRPWVDQALKSHAQFAFDGILANAEQTVPAVTNVAGGVNGEACWESDGRIEVPRMAARLATALSPLLANAREVIVVDAYFNPSVPLAQSKWLRPIHALAAQLCKDGRVARFEVHGLSARNDPWPVGLFAQHCRNNLPATLPAGISLTAMLWRERAGGLQFHERLIVTDIGGVLIDPGIDDGNLGETYTLRLLSRLECPAYLVKFAPASGPYDLIEQQQVIGSLS